MVVDKFSYIISKLLSLFFVPCSGSDEPEPEPISIKSSDLGSASGSEVALDNCQAGMEGGTTGALETEGNCFLK